MTCKPSLALLPALLLAAACSGGSGAAPVAADPGDWRAMLARGDGAGAEAALQRALDGGAPRPMLAPFMGEAALDQGDLDTAAHWLAGGVFAQSVAGHGYRMLGRLRIRQGDLAAAGHAFDRALRSGLARDPALWVDIGRLRYRGGEQAQAVAAAQKALALGPGNPAALLFHAQLVRDAQGNAAALPLFERGLAAAPADPDLLGDYAATLGDLGRATDALAAVRKLSEVAPGDRRVAWLQAVMAARAGNTELARSLLQRGGDLDRQVPAAILLLALIDLQNGNPDSAAQGLDRLARLQPDNDRVARLLALALARGGHDRELVARFEARAEVPYYALLVGRAHERLGERAAAAPLLDRAAAGEGMRLALLPTTVPLDVAELRGPTDGGATVALVRGLLARGQPAAARAKADAFLARYPGSADAMALAGDAAYEAGDARAALLHYRGAAAIRRPWALAKRMVAALDRTGDDAGGTALITAQLAGEPDNADAMVMLARRLFDRGDRDAAHQLAQRAREHGRNDAVLGRLGAGG